MDLFISHARCKQLDDARYVRYSAYSPIEDYVKYVKLDSAFEIMGLCFT